MLKIYVTCRIFTLGINSSSRLEMMTKSRMAFNKNGAKIEIQNSSIDPVCKMTLKP